MNVWVVVTAEPDARFIGVYASEKHAAAAQADTDEDVYVCGPFEVQGSEVIETPDGGSYYRALPDWMSH